MTRRRVTLAVSAAALVAAAVLGATCDRDGRDRGDGDTADRRGGAPATSAPARDERPRVTRHVRTDGDDRADGAVARPWRTLGRALPALRAGDTLVVGGGTYRERLRDLDLRRGRAGSPVRVVAAPGERPVVEGLLWLDDPDHWAIEGINVTWSSENRKSEHMVKITDGTGWSFTDAEVWGARSFAAILVAGEPSAFLLRGLYVHDTARANGRNEDHLIYLNCGTGGGIVERNILANSPNGRAVKVGPPDEDGPAVGNLTIRYNTMVGNLGPSNIQLAWSSRDVEIYRNVFLDPAPDRANVTAFEIDGSGNVVRDNVGWGGDGVVEDAPGLQDGGGNLHVDPALRDPAAGDFHPTNDRARAYGRYGGESE